MAIGTKIGTKVSHLTHMNRHVPVTVLAVYADGTCDLEASRGVRGVRFAWRQLWHVNTPNLSAREFVLQQHTYQGMKQIQPLGRRFSLLFPTCQVRVSRFYQSYAAPSFLFVWALPDLNRELQISVGTAGPPTEIWRSGLRSGSAQVRENARID